MSDSKPSDRPAGVPAHGSSEWAKDHNEEDRVEKMIKESGCWDNHVAVVECMSDQRDWRKCQIELNSFRECMIASRKKK